MSPVLSRKHAPPLGRRFLVALALLLFASTVAAQVAPVITKAFNPSTAFVLQDVDATITVSNPNGVPIGSVQFSDTMPAGIDLITQLGGTCSTPATAGGMFSINPGTETFSSTSTVLAAGQSCTIVVRVRGTMIGQFVNTTSQVTATGAPSGGPASATLTIVGPPSLTPRTIPALAPWMLGFVALLVAMLARRALP
jgi:uncharacterized repeat protein (TIGR01451 family)